MVETITGPVADREISLETGKMAKQANGSVVVRCGDTVLLATATMAKHAKTDIDFFPLTVEYSEKMYSAGKIPGGFFKREARPSIGATLTSRLIDRPIRPCFPKEVKNEVQVVVTVLSYDPTFSPEFLAIIAASSALSVSDIPFNGPIGAALVAEVDGQLVANPSAEALDRSTLQIVVAGSYDHILMVEAGASEVSEEVIIQAISKAHAAIRESIVLQKELVARAGRTKKIFEPEEIDTDLVAAVKTFLGNKIESNLQSGNKQEIEDFLTQLEADALAELVNEEATNTSKVKAYFRKEKKNQIRQTIINKKIRPDGRALDEVRAINGEVGLLPATHGSALFTRGETQSLGIITLGDTDDEQIEDGLNETSRKQYYFHYNFPPYSVGEVGFLGRTGRRELGHGALAERALKGILPDYSVFPYTIRIVSEILESNGSSSMASVCSGALALMDGGVPIKAPVSGIAMGLLIEDGDYVILSDIQGLEDHYGDMDFKVAGTSEGVTALQLDIKVGGLSEEILQKALYQAKQGRSHILGKMIEVISQPRAELSETAPKIGFIQIDPTKVGLVIGPGGKMIRKIEEETKATIIITDGTTGQVSISAKSQEHLDKAKRMIYLLTKEVEAGEEYEAKITRIMNFGAFAEILPGKEGLLHISTLSRSRINNVEDVLTTGQVLNVRVREVDSQNRINLEPVNVDDLSK